MEYVSGRMRAKGEMNGKSANLNNCLTQIYPEGTIIPHNELVSLFDLHYCQTVATKSNLDSRLCKVNSHLVSPETLTTQFPLPSPQELVVLQVNEV